MTSTDAIAVLVLAQPNRPVALPVGAPSIDITIGAVTTSTWASLFMFSITCYTATVYFSRYGKDQTAFKAVVASMWLLTAVDTAANLIWAYDWTVTLWGSIPGTGLLPLGFYVNILCAGLATAINQSFYAWRLFIISEGSYAMSGIIIVSAVSQLAVVLWALTVWATHSVLFKDLGIVL
ncbi:hypothetical protein AURDEDRAFT_176483 [Auricularia subglabra TFB-10046 SS5]|uniref:Uncharacterized protein n=1 Tax=Auricularia subglabra (strain TFB-10046 / SS5) TaxID=717982 RepID=J0LD58_AURST|nr:hypothetical protein AURDEDRAFT_176483 [Auricularia subglabra TFB-10046 SS5]